MPDSDDMLNDTKQHYDRIIKADMIIKAVARRQSSPHANAVTPRPSRKVPIPEPPPSWRLQAALLRDDIEKLQASCREALRIAADLQYKVHNVIQAQDRTATRITLVRDDLSEKLADLVEQFGGMSVRIEEIESDLYGA